MMNNEKKHKSRNRKKRIERKIKMDDKMKLLLNKIEAERKKKKKNLDEFKELEIEWVKWKYVVNPEQLQS